MLTPEAFSLIVEGIRFVDDVPNLIHEPIRLIVEAGELSHEDFCLNGTVAHPALKHHGSPGGQAEAEVAEEVASMPADASTG